MKSVPLRHEAPFKTIDVLKAVAIQPAAGQGINADEMRRRCRLLDGLDGAEGDALLIEDADHALLVRLVNGFQFGVADSRLLAIIDDVLGAATPAACPAASAETGSAAKTPAV